MATKHQQALAWLELHVGEHEVPMGKNTGPFVYECQQATWLPGTGWPWCVATWVKAWAQTGFALPYRGAGAYAFLDWYRQHLPSWVPHSITDAQPGAAVVFNIGSGHLAMLKKRVKPGDTTVTTIGGNESDSVKETARPLTLVRGVVDPFEEMPPAPPAKPPVYEVVTSESGHSQIVYVSGVKAISKRLDKFLAKHGRITIRRRKDAAKGG